MIRDANGPNHVIAIHKIYDSAITCFNIFMRSHGFERFLDILRVEVDEFGCVREELLMYTYSKESRQVINHIHRRPADLSQNAVVVV